jgi:4a-hydroxytetrahydrobiopterin dehydratase
MTLAYDHFRSATRFVNRVAAAEAASQHPDIDIRWNKVALTLTTHSADRFISNDTTLAHRIQQLSRPSPPAKHGRAVTSTGRAGLNRRRRPPRRPRTSPTHHRL